MKPEFVSYRGLLSALWKTPFEEQDGWIICAAKFEGTIYLCAFDTEEAKKRKANETPREKMMCSWGYKFEQFTLTGKHSFEQEKFIFSHMLFGGK